MSEAIESAPARSSGISIPLASPEVHPEAATTLCAPPIPMASIGILLSAFQHVGRFFIESSRLSSRRITGERSGDAAACTAAACSAAADGSAAALRSLPSLITGLHEVVPAALPADADRFGPPPAAKPEMATSRSDLRVRGMAFCSCCFSSTSVCRASAA